MNEQELKKLAEWAGFKWEPDGKVGWWTPDGKFYKAGIKDLPDFESLDACFKWLVPKLGIVDIKILVRDNSITCNLLANMSPHHATSTNETPALALCLAIEKLIDSEGK